MLDYDSILKVCHDLIKPISLLQYCLIYLQAQDYDAIFEVFKHPIKQEAWQLYYQSCLLIMVHVPIIMEVLFHS